MTLPPPTVEPPRIRPGCPKHMVFGPCGGVRSGGACEMQPAPCVFDDLVPWPADGLADWPGDWPTDGPAVGSTDGAPPPVRTLDVPLVLTDFSVPPFDPDALLRTAAILAPTCDAVLVGDHQDRPDFPPAQNARLLKDAGVVPWLTLACRDRNRVVLEQELRGLKHQGVDVVLCVTGDGRAFDVRPEVTQVFDLDGTRLAALAASTGLAAGVVETPTAPPRSLRAGRLVEKQRAGASIAVLNHVGETAAVARFLGRARRAGLRIPVIASVAVYTDEVSAAVLRNLPGLELDAATVDAVLGAADPVVAGIEAAVAQARALLAVDGVHGVNLSGLASARGYTFAAQVQAEIGARIRLEMG